MILLIVDDDPTNLKLLRAQFEAEGHAVFDAHDGLDALAVLERQGVDVVITDILMPRLDGYRLCYEIRRHPRLGDLPIIIYTATYTSPDDEKLALDVGADKYLVKPASVETLVAALNEVIAKPHAAPRAEAMPEIEVLKEYSERLVSKLEERNTELAAAEAKFRTLVEQSIVGIYVIQDGRFVYVNPKMAEIFGFSPLELTSAPVTDFIFEEDRPLALENIRKRMAGEIESIRYGLRMLCQDGRVIHVEVHGGRTKYHGQPAILGTLLDITQRKHAEEENQRLNADLERRVLERTAQLEAANKELEAFSYSVSHDLRSPLRAMDGFSRMVLEDFGPQLPEEGQRHLRTIRESAKRMGLLIDDLLTFSKFSRAPLNKREVDTGLLVRSVLDDLSSQREGRQIDLRIGDLPACAGDPALLRQVWINLLSNAFKYTHKREAAVVEVGCERKPEGNVYFVRDNGAGFDMHQAGNLFGVFQRLHSAEDYEGTGVGLAIVQRVIHRHGGRVWAQAAVDRGATFYFTLGGKPNPERTHHEFPV